MDGCNIVNTVDNDIRHYETNQNNFHKEDGDSISINTKIIEASHTYCENCQNSIFTGLASLKYLSLKENSISEVEACNGIGYFARFNNLEKLYLAENEIVEEKTTLDNLEEYLSGIGLTSLQNIDQRLF